MFSFSEKLSKDEIIRNYCINFEQQLWNFDPGRIIWLRVFNEFDKEKFICSFIKPAKLPFLNFDDWKSIKKFLCDFLEFNNHLGPCEIPKRLQSVSKTFRNQIGNIFELCIALVSLLIGASCNAFVVYGKVCKQLESILITLQNYNNLENCVENKFELQQKNYAWVLLKLSSTECVFIETVTGTEISLNESHNEEILKYFYNIESIWNHENYWINMMKYSSNTRNNYNSDYFDLTNRQNWQPVLDFEPINFDLKNSDFEQNKQLLLSYNQDYWNVDNSWNSPLIVTKKAFQMRYPQGKKKICLQNEIIEYFSAFLDPSGIEKRVTYYTDNQYSDLVLFEEFYSNREDCLTFLTRNIYFESSFESFKRGRSDGCSSHEYIIRDKTLRKITFFQDSRPDYLLNLEFGLNFLKESFSCNDKHVLSKREYIIKTLIDGQPIIEKICETFDTNRSCPYSYREFRLLENQIRIQLQYWSRDKITTSIIYFRKPQIDSSTVSNQKQSDEQYIAYDDNLILFYYKPLDCLCPKLSSVDFYNLLSTSLKDEKLAVNNFFSRTNEISEFANKRDLELSDPKLKYSSFK